MLNRIVIRTVLVLTLAVTALSMTACQPTGKAGPEMLGGETAAAHERHDTGIDSQTTYN